MSSNQPYIDEPSAPPSPTAVSTPGAGEAVLTKEDIWDRNLREIQSMQTALKLATSHASAERFISAIRFTVIAGFGLIVIYFGHSALRSSDAYLVGLTPFFFVVCLYGAVEVLAGRYMNMAREHASLLLRIANEEAARDKLKGRL